MDRREPRRADSRGPGRRSAAWRGQFTRPREQPWRSNRPPRASSRKRPGAASQPGNWTEQRRRPRLHPAQLHAVRRRRQLPGRRRPSAPRACGRRCAAAREGAREGHPRRLAGSLEHPGARAGLHRQEERDHRRPADRRAAEARDHAVRRLARGRGEPRVLRLQAGRAGRRDLHQVPQDPQRRRVRRLHGRHPGRTLVGHRHRPARRLRPRPDHRRLSPRGALRRRFPDRRQEAREDGARRPSLDRGRDPRCARNSPSRSARSRS